MHTFTLPSEIDFHMHTNTQRKKEGKATPFQIKDVKLMPRKNLRAHVARFCTLTCLTALHYHQQIGYLHIHLSFPERVEYSSEFLHQLHGLFFTACCHNCLQCQCDFCIDIGGSKHRRQSTVVMVKFNDFVRVPAATIFSVHFFNF